MKCFVKLLFQFLEAARIINFSTRHYVFFVEISLLKKARQTMHNTRDKNI